MGELANPNENKHHNINVGVRAAPNWLEFKQDAAKLVNEKLHPPASRR